MNNINKKLKLLTEILLFSKEQDVLLSRQEVEIDALVSVTETKQNLIDQLAEFEDIKNNDTESLVAEITELDRITIEKIRVSMESISKEMSEGKEKIRVMKAYQPVLGKEHNNSNRIDTKDNE